MVWGVGNLHALVPTCCFTYRDRVFIGMGSQFNFSDNGDPTGWEEQNPGAGFVTYLSQYGFQDVVKAFSQLQGRLAVLGGRSIQLWTTDADPTAFALVQVLDNVGTNDPLSVQNIGDYDVIFLDTTGFRSLRSREVTLNAFVDDLGAPVDSLIRAALLNYTVGTACGVVDPNTKNYWCYLGGNIYVLSRYLSSKISAWSQYVPVGNDGNTFVPSKFVIYNGRVYVRASQGGSDYLYLYGDSDNTSYDAHTPMTLQIPWLDDKRSATLKQFTNLNAACAGAWKFYFGTDPVSQSDTLKMPEVASVSGTNPPSALTDSTYDIGNFRLSGRGTHFSVLAVSQPVASKSPAKMASIVVSYNDGGKA